ncbi:MAG: T9SS type A sorting domain-containing protein [Alloprevotella sp.]|nr:T9SS type A sorting domain-containing protein [Alloprevotella sp.]MBR1652646.1 T9SS type A sorting domain-containing protein [Alloprevotella sp.]
MKKFLRYSLFAALLSAAPFTTFAADAEAWFAMGVVDIAANDVQIFITGSSLRIVGGQGMTVEVYNVTGVRVFSRHIDSNDQTFQAGLQRGCYMVKVGNTVRKVSIK